MSSLSPLTGLLALSIKDTQVTDISVVSSFRSMQFLDLPSNRIIDISAVQGLADLRRIDLSNNQVVDIGPLVANKGFAEGKYVILAGNPLNDASLTTHIPELQSRGVKVDW